MSADIKTPKGTLIPSLVVDDILLNTLFGAHRATYMKIGIAALGHKDGILRFFIRKPGIFGLGGYKLFIQRNKVGDYGDLEKVYKLANNKEAELYTVVNYYMSIHISSKSDLI